MASVGEIFFEDEIIDTIKKIIVDVDTEMQSERVSSEIQDKSERGLVS